MLINYPTIQVVDTADNGQWRVIVYTPQGAVDISVVRGITTSISSMTYTDPFGPAAAELLFPGLSALDALGEGDLTWWRAGNSVDIVWTAFDVKNTSLRNSVRWEGYIAGESVSFADDGGQIRMTLKGALMQADNTILMPEYPQRPWPFEHAISHALDRCVANGAQFKKMLMKFPENWTTIYDRTDDDHWWMQPLGVESGDRWTGLVTRDTGQFSQALTGYIQGLLASMHTDTGQFTLTLGDGRVPILLHRNRISRDPDCVIDMVTPGMSLELSCDYETKANVIFGKGRGLDGISFANMQYDLTGSSAYYQPFTYHPTVYPHNGSNSALSRSAMRRDVSMTFPEGMSHTEATRMAELYRQRFAQAGYAGTMTLTTDPYVYTANGTRTMPRHTIAAGDVIRVLHFQGRDSGVSFHITQATHDIESGSSRLTVDTVFRDHLTTDEVRLRGRDALTQSPSLLTGRYTLNIRDQLLPWGPDSGYLPAASRAVFSGATADPRDVDLADTDRVPFPWDELTLACPPSNVKWRACYSSIGPATNNLQTNWNNPETRQGLTSIVQLAQAGSISLLQIMAVDRNGARMKVPFHVSFYLNTGVTAPDMPRMDPTTFTHPLFPTLSPNGLANPPYPFFPNAWEDMNEDGSSPGADRQRRIPAPNAQGIDGGSFGTPKQPAGYFPGTPPADWMSASPASTGAKPTGLLSVESPFSWDVQGIQLDFNQYDASKNTFDLSNGGKASGIASAMIYCDSMWDDTLNRLVIRNKEVFFIGRLFRTPPGTG